MRTAAPLILLVFVASSSRGQFTYSTNVDGSLTVAGYTNASSTAQVPSLAYGMKVTEIGYLAFAGSTVQTVSLPDSINYVDPEAFLFCTNLTGIVVNATNAFYRSVGGVLFNKGNTLLEDFPGGVASGYTIPTNVETIGPYAFAGCELTNVTITANVTTIGQEAFWACPYLSSVDIPGTVTNFGSFVFWACSSISNVTFESGVNDVPAGMFYQCEGLQTVSFADTVTTIGPGAFDYCGSLGQVEIPASVTNIQDGAFANCIGLTNVFFLGNAPAVGSSIFGNDTSATAYYFPWTAGWSNFVSLRRAILRPGIHSGEGISGATNGDFGLNVTGPPGVTVTVQASEAPGTANWVTLTNVVLPSSGKAFLQDASSTNFPTRFYRAAIED